MKRILLLAAIYSLIIHQSKKNGKQILPGIQETMRKEIRVPARENPGAIASNNDLQKENTLRSEMNSGVSLLLWKSGE